MNLLLLSNHTAAMTTSSNAALIQSEFNQIASTFESERSTREVNTSTREPDLNFSLLQVQSSNLPTHFSILFPFGLAPPESIRSGQDSRQSIQEHLFGSRNRSFCALDEQVRFVKTFPMTTHSLRRLTIWPFSNLLLLSDHFRISKLKVHPSEVFEAIHLSILFPASSFRTECLVCLEGETLSYS